MHYLFVSTFVTVLTSFVIGIILFVMKDYIGKLFIDDE